MGLERGASPSLAPFSRVPALALVNKMDKIGADFGAALTTAAAAPGAAAPAPSAAAASAAAGARLSR